MNVKKLTLIDQTTRQELAYLYPGEHSWRDPFGGDFTEDEQRQMFGVATGDFAEVWLHGGTKHQRMITVLFAVVFG